MIYYDNGEIVIRDMVEGDARIITDAKPLHAYAGTLLARGFDLEDIYPNSQRTSRFYMNDLDIDQAA